MRSYYFNFYNKFCFEVVSSVSNEIEKYFVDEMQYLQTDNSPLKESLPRIGAVQIVDKINIPQDSSIYVFNSVYMAKDTLYFIYSSRLLTIEAAENCFIVTVEKDFYPLVAFYICEVLLRLYAVQYDIVFLHASAFKYKGKLFVINAFGGTGKTNLLLDVLEHGGIYLSDDIVAVDKANNLYPYKKRLNILYYNFLYKKDLLSKINISMYWLSLLEMLLKTEGTFFYKHFRIYKCINRLQGKLSQHIDYKKVVSNDEQYNTYDIDYFIWMERTADQSKLFPVMPEYFSDRMNCCLGVENKHVGFWLDYLMIGNPFIQGFIFKQNKMIHDIASRNAIIGLKKKSGDDATVFTIIHNLAEHEMKSTNSIDFKKYDN